MNHDLPARKVYVIFNVDFRSFVNKNCLKLPKRLIICLSKDGFLKM